MKITRGAAKDWAVYYKELAVGDAFQCEGEFWLVTSACTDDKGESVNLETGKMRRFPDGHALYRVNGEVIIYNAYGDCL